MQRNKTLKTCAVVGVGIRLTWQQNKSRNYAIKNRKWFTVKIAAFLPQNIYFVSDK